MRQVLYLIFCTIAMFASAGQAQTVTPQGRLTLLTGKPVMNADLTGQATIFYDCYAGNIVPVGATPSNLTITSCEVSMGLDAVTPHVASGSVYDIFAVSSSGLVLCVGPAWSSTTSRGTGAGTTELDQTNGGLWTNKNALTHCYGGASGTTDYGSVAVHAGTYLGSLYATANGQTGMQFGPNAAAGGSNNILGLYNAYNRVPFRSISQDNTAQWTWNSATWHTADASSSNRITWLDGLQQSPVSAAWSTTTFCSVCSSKALIGVTFDSTTATPTGVVSNSLAVGGGNTTPMAGGSTTVGLGLHYAQAMEASPTGTAGFYGTQSSVVNNSLSLFLMD